MKAFAHLVRQIDETTKTNVKVEALATYFTMAPDKDKLWTIALLSHRPPTRPVNTTLMRSWAAEAAGIDHWLFEESYHVVGDLAETIALLVSGKKKSKDSTYALSYYIQLIIDLREIDEEKRKVKILDTWQSLDYYECFVFNKIMTGGFRIGVSQKLMTRALEISTGIDRNLLAHKIMGQWDPNTTTFEDLILSESASQINSRPYPFFLAYAIDKKIEELGPPSEWAAEWKWDGIRAQLIRRGETTYIWSRGEELVTDKYPELEELGPQLPDGIVLDGEILAWKDDKPMDFIKLQKRIGRLKAGPKLRRNVPVIFMAYDIMEYNGIDIRQKPFRKRREILRDIVQTIGIEGLHLSPFIEFKTWTDLAEKRKSSRKKKVEGVMLKDIHGPYQTGRVKGHMWKWKIEPYTIDAVLTYAMRGHGRRANLYTDYTFGLWKDGALVTFAKAYSGLTDDEIRQVDRFVRQNTIERFGPVRQVRPKLVFELAFEGIARSNRHKSGVATRFPRISRWRMDKAPEEANSIEDILAMMEP